MFDILGISDLFDKCNTFYSIHRFIIFEQFLFYQGNFFKFFNVI